MARRTIPDLLRVPSDQHDLQWLKESLQWAVELEFATIPVYLSGLWSIEPPPQGQPPGPAYNLVRSVVLEEMLHLALSCNMVRALGEQPNIVAPRYPGHLPGGVAPWLCVYLAGLSPETVKMYMEIEKPEQLPPVGRDGAPPDPVDSYPTIGAFYDAISAAFAALSPPISTTGQLGNEITVPDPNHPSANPPSPITEAFIPLATLADVQNAIALIKDQGEGTGLSPDAPQFENGELAHYFRFGEIFHGKQYVQGPTGWEYSGAEVPFPACYPVASVPRGGYPDNPAVQRFDAQFGQLVASLQAAWTGAGSSRDLGNAIGTMFSLGPLAQEIVTQPLPDGSGNYGPDFITGATPSGPPPSGPGTGAGAMAVSFKADIVPLFTTMDTEHMSNLGVSLTDYDYMSVPANATAVYEQVLSGGMPPNSSGEERWSEERVQLFKDWMSDGYKP